MEVWGSDKGIGKYTFVGSKGSSVVDYVLSSQDLFKYINRFEDHVPNILSDHCLLRFSFSFEHDIVEEASQYNYKQAPGRFKWTSDFKTDFLNSLGNTESTDKLNRLNTSIQSCTETYELFCLSVIMWFLFGEFSSSSGCLGRLRYFIVAIPGPSI